MTIICLSLSHRFVLRWLLPNASLVIGLLVLLGLSSRLAGREFGFGAFTSIQFALNTNAAALPFWRLRWIV